MKKVIVFALLCLILTSFAFAEQYKIDPPDETIVVDIPKPNDKYEVNTEITQDEIKIPIITSKAVENSEDDDKKNGIEIQTNTKTSNKGDDSEISAAISAKVKAGAFCGTSTYASCESDSDCIAGGCSGSVCQGADDEPIITTCEYKDCYDADAYEASCRCIKNKCAWNKLTQNQIGNIIRVKNRIKEMIQNRECQENCTCSGSTVKCQLQSGREMTITAGKSGNIIFQTKSINASTSVELYKAEDGKLYATTKNNETKEVKIFPDEVKGKIKEQITSKLEDVEIELDEDAIYQYRAVKKAKLFGFIRVRQRIRAELGAEDGEIIRIRKPWWAFLASDVEDEEQEDESNEEGIITYAEALAIAKESACILEGNLIEDDYNYNEASTTWWINMEMFEEMEGCNPSCVVNEETLSAEINYMCTGLLIDEEICCKIEPVVLEPVPEYEWMLEEECSNIRDGEPIVGANHEIVDNSYCEEAE